MFDNETESLAATPTQVQKTPKVLACAVDYLTVTTQTGQTTARLLQTLLQLLGPKFLYNQKNSSWKFMGYTGTTYGSVRYGVRGDEGIVMVSGSMAGELWKDVAPLRERCSRIDIAATVELDYQDLNVATKAYEAAIETGSVKSSLVTLSRGGSICYLGARQSSWYGRLYDKGAEQDQEAGWVWRYEIEAKKPASEPLLTRLLEQENPAEFIRDYVHLFFLSRGIVPVYDAKNTQCAIEIETTVTSNDRALKWLTSQVAPTVGRLCVAGLEDEVRAALNLPAQQYSFMLPKEA